jgi:hypothetical protein
MKKFLLMALSAVLISSPAFAFLPVSAVTSMSLPVYGIYMSSDPSCTTGLVATVPLTLTPQAINFAANPAIGSGSVPATIGCVVIVLQNSFSSAWAAGTYTGTTTSNGQGGPYSGSDNIAACNQGGTTTAKAICHGDAVTWPTQITTDAAAIGLTLATGTCAGTLTEAVPLFLSTNSACTGNSTADANVTGCQGGSSTNNFSMPTSVGDLLHGTLMTAPSTAGNLKFVFSPSNCFGATSASTCGNTGPPMFSFAAN